MNSKFCIPQNVKVIILFDMHHYCLGHLNFIFVVWTKYAYKVTV